MKNAYNFSLCTTTIIINNKKKNIFEKCNIFSLCAIESSRKEEEEEEEKKKQDLGKLARAKRNKETVTDRLVGGVRAFNGRSELTFVA